MKHTTIVAGLLAAGVLTTSVYAAELDDVKAQMGKLQARIDQLEADRKGGTTAAGTTQGGTTQGGTTYSVGGYVQLDVFNDLKADQGGNFAEGRAIDMTDLPLRGSAAARRQNVTTFSAATSRLNFKTATPIDGATIKTRLEFDFFTTDGSETFTNSLHPRLRHAYGQVGNWLAGQTWSTFMDVDSLPETLEFTGPSGQVFIRQPLLRYTLPTGDKSSLALAVENPQADTRGGATPLDRGPDFAANWTMEGDFGHLSLRGLVRPLRVDDGTGNNQASKIGYGAGVSGILKLGTADALLYQVNVGKGAGRYIQDTNPAAAFSPSTAQLATHKAVGGFVGVQHAWGGGARSTLVVSATQNDNDPNFGAIASLNERTRQVHANYIFSPYQRVDVGVEYIWGQREQEDGQKGDLARLQGSVKFSF